jgi:hypothetical protein
MVLLSNSKAINLSLTQMKKRCQILQPPKHQRQIHNGLDGYCVPFLTFDMSVCPHVTERLPLGGFLSNLIFEAFIKICIETQNLVKSVKKISVTLYEHLRTLLPATHFRHNSNFVRQSMFL